ncbi:HEAT repeat domain-containing protein [Kitasatospora aureofaciens]|uniref:HEAT repeat domain-containing protein n=1 Tax=Kitasatospora aureofaciens TaxID=1894 RepID=UPI0036F46C34
MLQPDAGADVALAQPGGGQPRRRSGGGSDLPEEPRHILTVRRAAVQALGSAHDQTVTDLLVASTEDTDRWVRFWASWSLARRPGPAVRIALERLAADEDRDVREAARTVLEFPITT